MVNASDTIRAAIIGCGGIANGKHMPGLKKAEGVEMVAFCDIVLERAEAAANEYGTPEAKVYTDYKKLLEDETIDIVHVCTPNRSHSFITVDALEAGKHVMCEKPMAINSVEAKKMVDAARRTGKILTIGYQSRFGAEHMYMKYAADKGVFGDIYMAETVALRRRGVPTWGVFLDEYEQGGGALIDIGTHALDQTLWTMNNYKPKYCVGNIYHAFNKVPPEEQAAQWGSWDPEKFNVEDSAFGFITMENGATITLRSSWALNTRKGTGFTCYLYGTKAGCDKMDGPLMINGVRNGELYSETIDLSEGSEALLAANPTNDCWWKNWINAVRNNTDALVKPEEAYVVTQILEGIYESAKTKDIYRF